MYFPDLELCQYHTGPFDPRNWAVPLCAVGWLEYPRDFPKGIPPDPLAPRLSLLLEQMKRTFQQYNFRGGKTCSLCEAFGLASPGPIWSQENLLIPGAGAVYLDPGGIVHYIEAHSYLPPEPFIQGVLVCPDCDSPDYLGALREANAGQPPPLETWKALLSKK